jgi:polyisoprenoid-binding protein YceI
MARFDATSAICEVFTFKEGLLSPVAHDLRIRATEILVEVDGASVSARIAAAGLRVVSAMRGDHEVPELSPKDKREIEETLREKVLDARRFPEIRFRSTAIREADSVARIEGALLLHGVERPIALTARAEGALWSAEVGLSQPDFGIKPYSAMLGTLKVKAGVRVRIRLPRA